MGPGMGCREVEIIHGPFQTLKMELQLRIWGLEHCHVTNGHAGDRFWTHFSLFVRNYFRTPFL